MDEGQAGREASLHAPESGRARAGARAGAVAVEQLSELCFRGSGSSANQSAGQDKDENPGVGSMNSHLYKKRKGGPATDPYGMASFPARSYSLGQGRWATTDPAGMAAADPSDPQTWNRYAYVGNNPVSLTDPLGLGPCDKKCRLSIMQH